MTSGNGLAKVWVKHQLQRKYFNTTNAGEEFFQKMAGLPEDETELRGVYAYCLSLGFSGKYFREEDVHRINEIKQHNLRLLTDEGEIDYPEQLFPDAYAKTGVHRKWHNRPGVLSVILFILFPVIFLALYFTYDSMLAEILNQYTP